MRPFDDIPLEEGDYSDVALMVASVREWPADDFARELDERVARRFAPEAATARRVARVRLPRWAAGPAVALVAGAVAAVVVLSGGGPPPPAGPGLLTQASRNSQAASTRHTPSPAHRAPRRGGTPSGTSGVTAGSGVYTERLPATNTTATGSVGATSQFQSVQSRAGIAAPYTPVAPGHRQIQAAQISLSTPNAHVDQVAQEVFQVVGEEHGTVQSSHITAASRGSGGGYASFSLSIPTSNLQATMTDLSRLHFAAVQSRTDTSQNVSHQYNSDQRQLADAKALRSSLLKQLQSAYTQSDIDSIKAQLKLAEQRISSWQNALGSLQHRISYSNVSVQINQNGLPIQPVRTHEHHSGGFTIGGAGHDALRVLVVSAGVALIALAVMIPVGLVAALLMWLWVWLRQRRREQALDTAG